MKTSYYAKSAKDPNAVSIALSTPSWYKGREYKVLAPTYGMLSDYKKTGDEVFYTSRYRNEILRILDPERVWRELGENAVLLCYEKSGKFCHRHLVSKWLSDSLGIVIEEVL